MPKLMNIQKRLWAEVNINNIIFNLKTINKPVCCVVKANAYGHGAISLARIYEKCGVNYFAVSNIEEAIQLRNAGIKSHILILGYTPVKCAKQLAQFNLEQTVYNVDYASALSKQAFDSDVFINIHLKIDTGMGRIGFQFHNGINELSFAYEAACQPRLNTIGIFTHFAISDEGVNNYTKEQFKFFTSAITYLEDRGIKFQVKHCSNSAAIIDYPEYHLDFVRAGLSLYGINPTKNKNVVLKPALSLWSVVSNVKIVRKGDSISYGRTFIADRDMQIATIPIGYADGFWRSNQGNCVFINGEYCRIVGRVCMDQIMVECNNAKIGDLVEIYGEHITIEKVASYNHTIPYEILCAIGERVPRVYIKDRQVVEIVDKLI